MKFSPFCFSGLAGAVQVSLLALVAAQVHGQAPTWPLDGPSFSASTEEIQKAAAKVPAEQFAEATVLFERDAYTIDAHGRVTYRHSMIWRIETKAGVDDWTESSSRWEPWYQKRPEIHARVIAADGKVATLVPAATSSEMTFGSDVSQRIRLALFGTYASTLAKPGAQFRVSANLRFTGAQRIAVLAYGKSTRLSVQSNWPNPSFDGGFLPASRTISPSGFTGQWSVPFIARGVRAEGPVDTITGLEAAQLGVSLVEVADPYQSVNRALKYVLLFLGLVFLSYFVFEVPTGKRVHPAQYILVGVAQIIFYLLLLSLAERVGFDWGFLIAGGATVGLLAANAGWIFHSRLQGVRALAVFSLLYGLIYLLLRLEDNALLVGAVASFVAVAAAMYFTRKIDWYSSLPPSTPNPPSTPGNKPVPASDLSLRA